MQRRRWCHPTRAEPGPRLGGRSRPQHEPVQGRGRGPLSPFPGRPSPAPCPPRGDHAEGRGRSLQAFPGMHVPTYVCAGPRGGRDSGSRVVSESGGVACPPHGRPAPPRPPFPLLHQVPEEGLPPPGAGTHTGHPEIVLQSLRPPGNICHGAASSGTHAGWVGWPFPTTQVVLCFRLSGLFFFFCCSHKPLLVAVTSLHPGSVLHSLMLSRGGRRRRIKLSRICAESEQTGWRTACPVRKGARFVARAL